MITQSTMITIDDTIKVSTVVHKNKDENVGILEFSNIVEKEAFKSKAHLIFGHPKGIELFIDILKQLKERMEESEKKILVPGKKLATL